jgi:hypothetical protein
MLSQWLSKLDESLTKQWRLGNLRVLAQNVPAKLAARLHLLRKRRRRRKGGFGGCHAWTRMQVLLPRLVMKCQQRSFLRLIPMGVSFMRLIPMCVSCLRLIPMGVYVLKLIPMGVTVRRLLFVYLMKIKKKKKKSH